MNTTFIKLHFLKQGLKQINNSCYIISVLIIVFFVGPELEYIGIYISTNRPS